MADILEEQLELHHRITRVVENLKKRGKASMNVGTIKARIKVLDEMWDEFKLTHRALRSSTVSEVRKADYFTQDCFEHTQEAYIEQMGYLTNLLEAEEQGRPKIMDGTLQPSQAEGRSRAVLPRINLPSFDGDYRSWPAFRDLFHSLIVMDPSLSDVERLHYLKGCLKSEAASLINNITITEGNYKRAWKMLEERYQNERLLVSSQLEALFKIPSVTKESASELKRLLYGTCEVLEALEALGRNCCKCDLVVHLTSERLDRQSRREWEASLGASTEPPAFDALKEFLEARIRTVEALDRQRGDLTPEARRPSTKPSRVLQVTKDERQRQRCGLCKGDHRLLFCTHYSAKSPAERRELVNELQLCINCLGKHSIHTCPSAKRCQRCSEKHHTSLHPVSNDATPRLVQHTLKAPKSVSGVLLGTALLRVVSDDGSSVVTRALIDPGSEVSLVSERLTQHLGLKRQRSEVPLIGIGGRTRCTRGLVHFAIQPHSSNALAYSVSALVLPHLSLYKPPKISVDRWPEFQGITLADPDYTSTQSVELLLGADVYGSILKNGVRRSRHTGPVAQETGLGWLLTGRIAANHHESRRQHSAVSLQCSIDRELLSMVERFWTQEEVAPTKILTQEEQECENHFSSTHRRTSEGRFVVRLPFKAIPALGDTKQPAARMLTRMENQFLRNPGFQDAYKNFMDEYEKLGHMSRVHPTNGMAYLPHHGVLNASSTTTKLRVVFNGSWSTSNGKSLNDHLHSGPNLLPALADVLTRWRRHRVSFTADVEKMYRQIFVHSDDRAYQRILWRASLKNPVQEYQLNTVTYGLTCAPYLAIRCLLQLADDGEDQYPMGARVIREDIYVDDVLSGAATAEEARVIRSELNTLLMAGGFQLRKWASNTPEVLTPGHVDETMAPLTWETEAGHSILGIKWLPTEDLFVVQSGKIDLKGKTTKRSVLSTVAQIFDPLGWLAPVTVWAKSFLQSLWHLKLEWDDPLPSEEERRWRTFVEQLPLLQAVRIQRWLGLSPTCKRVELHGFADASERAYAAVIYLLSTDDDGQPQLHLVASKTRVAPLKQVSLPRLELCAAQLAARLAAHVQEILHLQDATLKMWSDSTVTLSWIDGHPTKWKTYVANRVADIQRLVPRARWYHVSGKKNPADCASRGLLPQEFVDLSAWWNRPSWLLTTADESINPGLVSDQPGEEAVTVLHAHKEVDNEVSQLLHRFSSYRRLLRVTAWCCRWLLRDRGERKACLTARELCDAGNRWLRRAQSEAFPEERRALAAHTAMPPRSRLIRLNPYLDGDGILRVGGRLQHSSLPHEGKHPRIVPPESHLAALIIDDAHQRCLHGGTQMTLATIRQKHWILRGRQAVKGHIAKCITCIRWRNQLPTQLMGSLPAVRVTPGRAFKRVGVDYAGPIQLRAARGRGQMKHKGYICVFVCLTTRAVHLEVVSDCSTDAFIAALKRFVARRGICQEIWSDCGTAFVGADRELRTILTTTMEDDKLHSWAAENRILWKFNPPGAPHFGGIWEAAVKSAKHHLRRIIGETTLTFEEMTTLLAGIEACLNSRPLQPLSDDPDELEALTPAHFLIGEALTAVPEPSYEEVPVSRLSRWQLLTQMRQHFWNRWSREYLTTLQERGKWLKSQPNVRIGDLCLVRNELLPPTRWPLARVTQIHPGTDGLVRVISLKTAKSEYKRPLTKIVLLPSVTSNAETSTGTATHVHP